MHSPPLVVVSISGREFSEYLLWADMYRGLHAAGVLPVSIDSSVAALPVPEIMAQADGLILAGGGDVSPLLYGGDPLDAALLGVDLQRDQNELDLLRRAIGEQLPVLGVCRGSQLLNVARGGTLVQDLRRDAGAALEHRGAEEFLNSPVHEVCVEDGSLLARLLGGDRMLMVNSAHHQAVAKVGEGLRVVARAFDGTVEAVESSDPTEALVGVQWHPENLWRTQAHARHLLQGFAELCVREAAASAVESRHGRSTKDVGHTSNAGSARAGPRGSGDPPHPAARWTHLEHRDRPPCGQDRDDGPQTHLGDAGERVL